LFTLVSFGITNMCVLKCPHCYRDASKRLPNELSEDECMNIIDQLHNIGTRILVFSGGEPLTRSDIFNLIRYADSKKINTALATSGLLLNEYIIKKLADSNLKFIAISLDSTKPEIHDRFRGIQGLWNHVVNSLKILKDYGIKIQINFTLCKYNVDDVINMVEFCIKNDIDNLHIFHVVPVGRAFKYYEDIKLDIREVLNVCLKAVEYGFYNRINVKPTCIPQFWPYLKLSRPDIYNSITRGRSIGCIAGISYMYISPTGDVYPCPYLPYKVGNVREGSLEDIINSEVFRRLRSRDLSGRCRDCKYRDICGGCRARAFSYFGDLFSQDPECCIYDM